MQEKSSSKFLELRIPRSVRGTYDNSVLPLNSLLTRTLPKAVTCIGVYGLIINPLQYSYVPIYLLCVLF